MRTKSESSLIRNLVQGPQWPIIESLAKEIIARIKDASSLRDDMWQTARAVAENEGQIQGINILIQELYRIAGEQ